MYFSPSMSGTFLATEIYLAKVQMYEADIDTTLLFVHPAVFDDQFKRK